MNSPWDKPQGERWDDFVRVTVTTNRFMRDAAPVAFTWVEWSLVLALIRYVEQRAQLWQLSVLLWVLGVLLWLHFMHFFSEKADEPSAVKWFSRDQLRLRLIWAVGSLVATASMVAASFWFAAVFQEHPF